MATHTVAKSGNQTTYDAIFRLAARPYALSVVAGGAGRTQAATLYHLATSKKDVKISAVELALESASAAAIVVADLVKLTAAATPATGNPAITPTKRDEGDPAAEVTCLALPTTPGTEGAVVASLEFNEGITGAASTNNPPPPLSYVDLFRYGSDMRLKPLLLRGGFAEGVAVVFDISAAATVKGFVIVTFTEADAGVEY